MSEIEVGETEKGEVFISAESDRFFPIVVANDHNNHRKALTMTKEECISLIKLLEYFIN